MGTLRCAEIQPHPTAESENKISDTMVISPWNI